MAHLNSHYLKLKAGYLFPEIARRVTAFLEAILNAAARLIRYGIGDVTEPLPAPARAAMHGAVDGLGRGKPFTDTAPSRARNSSGRPSRESDYCSSGLEIADDGLSVSDGSKCDCANFSTSLAPTTASPS